MGVGFSGPMFFLGKKVCGWVCQGVGLSREDPPPPPIKGYGHQSGIQLQRFLVSSAGIICELSASQQDNSARTFAHLAAIVRITER